MKNTLEHSLSKSCASRWILLSLTAMCWLFVCVWMFETAGFRVSDFRLMHAKPETYFVEQQSSAEIVLAGDMHVPKLMLINEDINELEQAGSKATADPSTVKVMSRPAVINVDVFGFTAQDRANEVLLDAEEKEGYRESISVFVGEGEAFIQNEGRGTPGDIIGSARVLDRMFDPLYLYSRVRAFNTFATNESKGAAIDKLLGRGQTVIAFWVNRGLEVDRFSIFVQSGVELPVLETMKR